MFLNSSRVCDFYMWQRRELWDFFFVSCGHVQRLFCLHRHAPTHFIQPYLHPTHFPVCLCVLSGGFVWGSKCRHTFCVFVCGSGCCLLASVEQKSWFIYRSRHSFIKISTNTTLSFWSAQGAWHVHNMSDYSQSRLRGRNDECPASTTVGVLSASWQSWHSVAPSVWVHTILWQLNGDVAQAISVGVFKLFDAKDSQKWWFPF